MQEILEARASGEVRAYIVWEPITLTDIVRPSRSVLARVTDGRAAQFWDPGHLTALRLAQALDAHDGHPRPSCCWQEGILWDVVAVYPRGARWEGMLPRAVYLDGPVWRLPLRQVVEQQLQGAGAGYP